MAYVQFKSTGWVRGAKVTTTGTAPSLLTSTEPTNMIHTHGHRGVRFMFFNATSCTCGGTWGLDFYRVDRNKYAADGPAFYVCTHILSTSGIYHANTCGTSAAAVLGKAQGPWTTTERLSVKQIGSTACVSTSKGTKLLQYVNGVAGVDVGSTAAATRTPCECWISDLANAWGIVPVATTFTSTNRNHGWIYKLDL